MTFAELIKTYAESIGLDELEPNEFGVCHLMSEDIIFTLQDFAEADKVLIMTDVAEVLPEDTKELYRKLLAANYLYSGSGGAVISIDEAHELISMSRYGTLSQFTDESFAAFIQNFAESAFKIKALIEQYRLNGETEAIEARETLPLETHETLPRDDRMDFIRC